MDTTFGKHIMGSRKGNAMEPDVNCRETCPECLEVWSQCSCASRKPQRRGGWKDVELRFTQLAVVPAKMQVGEREYDGGWCLFGLTDDGRVYTMDKMESYWRPESNTTRVFDPTLPPPDEVIDED